MKLEQLELVMVVDRMVVMVVVVHRMVVLADRATWEDHDLVVALYMVVPP